jgi:hypothetical protein
MDNRIGAKKSQPLDARIEREEAVAMVVAAYVDAHKRRDREMMRRCAMALSTVLVTEEELRRVFLEVRERLAHLDVSGAIPIGRIALKTIRRPR